jgi:hypothetical protein
VSSGQWRHACCNARAKSFMLKLNPYNGFVEVGAIAGSRVATIWRTRSLGERAVCYKDEKWWAKSVIGKDLQNGVIPSAAKDLSQDRDSSLRPE